MPIKLPNLDTKTFDRLMEEMISSIPKYTKEWTNFNPSDPGITILELAAWVCESLIYRADKVPKKSYFNFLKLVAGTKVIDKNDLAHVEFYKFVYGREPGDDIQQNVSYDNAPEHDIPSMKAAAQTFLRSTYRAVTVQDYRDSAIAVDPDVIKRVEVSAEYDIVTVVVIPDLDKIKDSVISVKDNKYLSPINSDESSLFIVKKEKKNLDDVIHAVQDLLNTRRLLGTLVDVEKPNYTEVKLRIAVVCEPYKKTSDDGNTFIYDAETKAFNNLDPSLVEDAVAGAIWNYFHSLKGGPNHTGWPYNRSVSVYELYSVTEAVDAVKYVMRILYDSHDFKTVLPEARTFDDFEPFTEIKIDGLVNLKYLEVILEDDNK